MGSWGRDLRVAVVPWVVARAVVAATFVVAHALGADDDKGELTLEQGLLAWDGDWYRAIAESGYDGAPDGAIRYFPGYPIAGRVLGWLLAGRSDVALVVLANVAALAATVVLVRLARHDLGADVARRTAWWFSLFPASFVLTWAYSESLFVLAAALTMLGTRTRRWWLAGASGLAAALVRPTGVLLSVFVAVDGWSRRHRRDRLGWLAATTAPFIGLGLFLLWAEAVQGSWRAPVDAQRDIRGSFHEPVTRVLRSVGRGVTGDQTELLHAVAAAVFVTVVVIAFRRRPSYLAYGLVGIVVGLAASTINSFERYGLGLVPVVIGLGALPMSERAFRLSLAASALGMIGLGTVALTGSYVP
ncbi:MAG: glycosyltransferase 87 family protein [Acidimicrobiia bacterium]|nr:glycosyltransferase 87 family protein [Acidimicrobiia bacterium]